MSPTLAQHEAPAPDEIGSQSLAHLVHAALRFGWVLWRKKTLLLVAMGVSLLLGALYYGAATRIYQSNASLLVLQTNHDLTAGGLADGANLTRMGTYEQLFTSAVVLDGAIERLKRLPPELAPHSPRHKWIEKLRRNMTVASVKQTSIVGVGYRSESPEAAADVVHAVVESYLSFVDENHRDTTTEIVDLLGRELTELEARMKEKGAEWIEAQQRHGDFSTEGSSSHTTVQTALKMNEALIAAQAKRIETEAWLAAVRETTRQGGDLAPYLVQLRPMLGDYFVTDAFGVTDRDFHVESTFHRQIVFDRAELALLGQHYGPAHPEVQALEHRIHVTNQYLAEHRRQMGERLTGVNNRGLADKLLRVLEESVVNLWRHENTLREQYQKAVAEAVAWSGQREEIRQIERDIKQMETLRNVLVDRVANIRMQQNRSDIRVSVVSEPSLPDRPVSPVLWRTVLLCLGVGLVAGAGLVYTLDVLDDRFRSPEELQEQLGAPVLAMIRRHDALPGVGLESLAVYASPDAVESEAFRTLRTAMAFTAAGMRRFVVSSSEPGDGKTTVMANLAVACAQSGKKTLLIDGDLRRPGLTNLFAMRSLGGLSDVLRGHGDVAEACCERIQPTGVDGFDILPSGPRPTDPAELLSGERMSDVLAWAEGIYDLVLVDSSPILVASDTMILGRLVDGLIMVVQPEKNHRRIVLRAAESLAMLGVQLLGLVINKVEPEEKSSFYGYGYGSGYGYGYGYGEDEYEARDSETAEAWNASDASSEAHADKNESQILKPRRAA